MTATLVALLQLVLVAYLPGAALYRLPFWERERRAALDAEERLFWHVSLSVAWTLTMVLALAAAGWYRFDLLLAINAVVTSAILLIGGRRLKYGGTARQPSWTIVIPVALIVLGCWRFFPVSEYIIGGKDPGVYVNEGIQIAQRGSLIIDDAVVSSVPAFARQLFFPPHHREEYFGTRFMGIFVRDPEAGTVIGQFPHLFPASIAIGYGLDGLTGGLEAVAWWALLGVAAVYFLAARWTGRLAAAAAATLLTLHVTQVWFARYPNTDIVMQAGLFAALLAFARATQDDDRFFAPVAAWLLALQLCSRVEALLATLVLAVAAVLTWAAMPERRWRWSFVVPAALGTWIALHYLTTLMQAYFWRAAMFLENLPRVPTRGALAVGVVLLAWLGMRRQRLGPLVERWLPVVVATAMAVLAIYAYFFRQPGGGLADHDAYAVRTFIDVYLWWPVAVAAIAGLVLAARKDFWRDPAFILTFSAFAVFLLYKLKIVPEHFWLARRFVPIILPGALVLACRALFGGAMSSGWTRPAIARAVAASAIVVVAGQHYAAAAAPVVPHIEYRNIIPYLERLAARFTERDLIVVESRDAQSDVHVLGLPLAYIYAKPVLVLNSAKPDRLRFRGFLEDALKKYDRVFYVGTGGTTLLSRQIVATPIDSDRVQVDEFEVTLDRLPRQSRSKEFDYGVYQLTVGRSVQGPFTLDVGLRDDLHVLRFHAKERSEGRTIRWTQRASEVALSGLAGNEEAVTLLMSDGGRPRAAVPARVRVLFNGVQIGDTAVSAGFQEYVFPIPAPLAAAAAKLNEPATLRLESTLWSPADTAGARDTRQLGVMVDTVTVR